MIRLILLNLSCGLVLAQTQSVTGTVVDALTNNPISRAKIALSLNGSREAVLTDGTGSFAFARVPRGKYTLSAEHANYVPQNGLWNGSVVVEPEKAPTVIRLQLLPTAKLSGNVFDENGSPFPFTSLQFFRKIVSEGRATVQQITTQGASNDLGEYRVATLEPGQYFVCAMAMANGYQKRHSLTYQNPCLVTEEPGSAELLDLRPGEERHLDLHVKPVPCIRFSGSVDLGAADPAASLSLYLRRISAKEIPLSSYLNVSFDRGTSRFQADEIPVGDYLLVAQGNYMGRNVHTMQVVHARSQDIRDYRLVLGEPTYFSGTVQMGGLPPMQIATIVQQSRPAQQISIQVRGSGAFRQILDPGEFQVRVIPPPGWMVHSVKQGGLDLRDRKISIGLDGSPEPVRIVLAQGGGTLEVALDSDSKDKALKVVLLRRSLSSEDWVQEGEPRILGAIQLSRMMLYTLQGIELKQDATGATTLSNLPPGDYTVLGLPLVGEIEYLNPEVLQAYQDYQKSVSVREGETTRVTIKPLRLK